MSCMAVEVWPKTLASLQCRDGERRVATNQADIICTNREGKREAYGDPHEG